MKQPFLDTLYNILIWLFQIIIGLGTKLALESRKRKITKKYIVTSFIIACFVGYIIDKIWTLKGWPGTRGVAVAISALVSESIVKYINDNLPAIINVLLKKKLDVDIEVKKDDEETS